MAVSDKLGMYLPTREDYISVKRDISDNLAILDAAAGNLDILINGNTASQNVTTGEFVTVINSTITGITDGLYKAVADVAAGVPFVAANLTTVSSGALNELNNKLTQWKDITSDCTINTNYTWDGTKVLVNEGIKAIYISVGEKAGTPNQGILLAIPSKYILPSTDNCIGISYDGTMRLTLRQFNNNIRAAHSIDTVSSLSWQTTAIIPYT